jgi:hypothetical protein
MNLKALFTSREILAEIKSTWQNFGAHSPILFSTSPATAPKCRAADIPYESTFNCQPGKVDLEEPAQEMQG